LCFKANTTATATTTTTTTITTTTITILIANETIFTATMINDAKANQLMPSFQISNLLYLKIVDY
jgi:hypothetical protein